MKTSRDIEFYKALSESLEITVNLRDREIRRLKQELRKAKG